MGNKSVLIFVLAVTAAAVLLVLWFGPFFDQQRPNVVLLVLDCVRADHLGCYGYARPTSPHIDALAEKGCLFNLAFSQSPWTVPSVSSLLTGCYPARHRAGVPMDDQMFFDLKLSSPVVGPDTSLPQMSDLFRDAGYKTYFFSSNTLVRQKIFGQNCSDFALKVKAHAGEVVDYGIKMIRKASRLDEPFFLYLHFMDSHQPLHQPEPYFSQFRTEDKGDPVIYRDWKFDSAEDQTGPDFLAYKEQKISVYDGSIRYTDEEIGRLFEKMKELGVINDTIIVFLSDHGESLWDHADFEARFYRNPKGTNGIGHGHTLFQELVHVPLIVAGPGISKSARSDRPVELIDVFPTLIEIAELPGHVQTDGQSFAMALAGQAGRDRPALYSESPAHGTLKTALVRYPFKYIYAYNEQDFLFNIKDDPLESEDLKASMPELAKILLKSIEERRGYYEAIPAGDDQSGYLMEEEMEQLRALGYIK